MATGHGWLYDTDLRAEVFELISATLADADADVANALVQKVAARAEVDERGVRWTHNSLVLITRAAPELTSAQEALATIRTLHPELVEPEQGEEQSNGPQLPTTAQELHDQIADDLPSVHDLLIQFEAVGDEPILPRSDALKWQHLATLLSEVVKQWPQDGFSILDSVGPDHPGIARSVIHGWASAQLDNERGERVVRRIAELDLPPLVHYVTQMLAGYGSPQDTSTNWRTVPGSTDLAKRCWDAINRDMPPTLEGSDLASRAINHPAGLLADFWASVISEIWTAREKTWIGLPAEIADYLAMMLDINDARSEWVEVVFAGWLHFFYTADPAWCKAHLLPRFTWLDETRAHRMWDRFLSQGTWNNGLLSANFLSALIECVPHRADFPSNRGKRLLWLLAAVAMFADVEPAEWLPSFLTHAPVDDRAEWAKQVAFHLGSLPPDGAEQQWHRWIKIYWTNRLNSLPMPLEIHEASQMARWTLFFTESMPDAIELALQHPARFEGQSHFLYDLTRQEGDSRLARAPEQIAKLIALLLNNTEPPFFGGFELPRIVRKLEEFGATPDAIGQIKEQAIHLGISLD